MNADRHFRLWDALHRPWFAMAILLFGASILAGCASTMSASPGVQTWLDKMDQASEKAKFDSLRKAAEGGNAKSMYYLGLA
jgi:negative regulator of sigma E activity